MVENVVPQDYGFFFQWVLTVPKTINKDYLDP